MSSNFRFPSHRLQELVKASKCPVSAGDVKWKDKGTRGKELRLPLDLVDGLFAGFCLHVHCGDAANPTTYHAALVLEGERVRGVDCSEVSRMKRYKKHIEKGWHENVIDPNLPLSDPNQNRHGALENFEANDLQSFLRAVCRLWQIDLDFEKGLL